MKNSLGSEPKRFLFMIQHQNQQLIETGRLVFQETSGNKRVL